jgi:hypothetical protein
MLPSRLPSLKDKINPPAPVAAEPEKVADSTDQKDEK